MAVLAPAWVQAGVRIIFFFVVVVVGGVRVVDKERVGVGSSVSVVSM